MKPTKQELLNIIQEIFSVSDKITNFDGDTLDQETLAVLKDELDIIKSHLENTNSEKFDRKFKNLSFSVGELSHFINSKELWNIRNGEGAFYISKALDDVTPISSWSLSN